jgi:hypothetical protein
MMGVCPKCGAELTNYFDPEIEGDSVTYLFSCDCGATGIENYVLEYCCSVLNEE